MKFFCSNVLNAHFSKNFFSTLIWIQCPWIFNKIWLPNFIDDFQVTKGHLYLLIRCLNGIWHLILIYLYIVCYQTKMTFVPLLAWIFSLLHTFQIQFIFPLLRFRPTVLLNPRNIRTHTTTQSSSQYLKSKAMLIQPFNRCNNSLQKFSNFLQYILHASSEFLTIRNSSVIFLSASFASSPIKCLRRLVLQIMFWPPCSLVCASGKPCPFCLHFSSPFHFSWLISSYNSGQLKCHLLRWALQAHSIKKYSINFLFLVPQLLIVVIESVIIYTYLYWFIYLLICVCVCLWVCFSALFLLVSWHQSYCLYEFFKICIYWEKFICYKNLPP